MSAGTLTRSGPRPAPNRRGGSGRAAPPVDPRLKARRIEVQRGRTHRRLRRILGLAVVALLAVGVVLLSRSPLLDVDTVRVVGASHTDAAALRTASGIRTGDPLVSVDAGRAARRLEALPWVANASVSRSWKGAVVLRIQERVPVAVVGSGDAARLVDRAGRVLGADPAGTDRAGPDLPVIEGAVPADGRFLDPARRDAVAVVAGLPKALAREVAAIRTGPGVVDLTLVDGIRVRMGDGRRLAAKATALGALLELPGRDTIATIDVRAPATPSLTRTPSTDGAPEGSPDGASDDASNGSSTDPSTDGAPDATSNDPALTGGSKGGA